MTPTQEIARRRTLAIISHPDAGKTTLTEKLLLYGGAVQLAGSVTARKNQRATTSDWMELEKQRGISVSSTVLQFDYNNYVVNLLDTPGHHDFSEDTYRVLMAVDAVIMVLDAAKGIESQTLKLFEICRLRGIPIFTFINKLDRPSRAPLGLLDEIENTLQLQACAMNWPLGDGVDFRGVYDRQGKLAHFFERTVGGASRAPEVLRSLQDLATLSQMPADAVARLTEEIAMLDAAGAVFDEAAVRAGDMTPVFFGSALNNFGVQLLLDFFLAHAPPPGPRKAGALVVPPQHDQFSGFIFKIQSNMDPQHRDQIAFLRICSGVFQRDMKATHPRTGKVIRLSNSRKLFARDRETVDEAYPGDVIGLVGHPEFGIGDTLTADPAIVYDPLPQFAAECFAWLHHASPAQFKRFRAGLDHLLQEGAVQTFTLPDSGSRAPLLGAVGPLQFEVLQYRLENEYGAVTRREAAPWTILRWVDPAGEPVSPTMLPSSCRLAFDTANRPVALFSADWELKFFQEKNPRVILQRLPPA
ncbi:MAG TPA: peptide chain release factor 3 [Kiritimatiellia bacterium]|jgi:peptide chain release factor 3|nr:peptide chain release factor 3 [Kiritimatiellia bacterium]HOR74019.1 peptide chain release factor 3 [Kiritimatiellia bacterium]HOU58777.1 peptide chain release factor 3 [Kiritimatiellia bacterium]HPK68972.1 peptide chain release factor 3 [Kiritimatiellia bacterium]HPV47807.1 peptide chain release factor 3 [Kiritimatiellia bacterium]